MTFMNYGIRAGGGIGDFTDKVSFKAAPGTFVGRFFFDVIFHILMIWSLGNFFLGVIVDSFTDLRDKTEQYAYDLENVCFICQLDRDDSIRMNINFENHVTFDHNMMNYIYFITYLQINDPNNFKPLESYVYDQLNSNNSSWIPLLDKNNDYERKK